MKVDSTEEEDDDDGSPFDWIANAFHRMIRPSKKVHNNRKFLGPIRVPGLNDDVFIKQLQSNAKSRVVIRVMPQPNMNMPYDQSQYYHNQQFQPQPPSPSYYYQQPQTSPTRPLQTSGGFMPVSQPTLSSWTQPQQYYQQNYNKNLPNNYNNNNYQYQNYQQPRYQYSNPYNQPYHQPYSNSYSNSYSNQQQNSYGTWNNIPNKSNKTPSNNYYSGSLRSTNYPSYPPYNDQSHENYDNHTISDDEYNQLQNDEIELPKVKSTTAKTSSSEYNEVFRSDRMVPTNPTWKNRFWVNNKSGKSTTTTTTERSHDDDDDDNSNKNNDDNDSDDVQKGKKRSLKGRNKFSSTGIQVISAPDLNSEKENDPLSDSSSRMDDDDDDDNDGVIIKNHSRLNRGESLDHTNDNKKNINDENLNWKSSKSSSRINNDNIKLNNSTENNVKRIMSLSENHWKHYNLKRPFKNSSGNKNNKNKKIRVVENVVSSVSMTSSKGTLKLPKTKNHS
ncbi:probable serine/threonine-protein kinase clkA isoform X2 [Aphidius gifuensis]|nr:probable serine/threonine-protein kinase clkA isoform X2 [Aphidius gifuensis]